MRKLLLSGMILCLGHSVLPQNSLTLIGARASALGYASSCLKDEWSLFNNVGGLSGVEHPAVATTCEVHPQFLPFTRRAVAVVLPLDFGAFGLGAFKFGDDLYNEQIASLAFGNQFGTTSLGLKASYNQFHAEGFGRKGVLSLSFGGISEITPGLCVGAHIININHPRTSAVERENLPTLLIAGLRFNVSKNLFLTVEAEKDLDYDVTIKGGAEYEAAKKVIFRTGFNINPGKGFIGLGYRLKNFLMDYAFTYDHHTGHKHQATVVCQFKRKPK